MKLSRAKAFTSIVFIAFCLLFSYQFSIFAQQLETNIPAELQALLQGKSSDFSSAASQLKETDLPAALAVIELLKFKALHQEIPASIDQINDFESQIKSRLENSSVVSFAKTETCRKKIEATEIEVADQKIAIPEHYISEAGLAITGVIPTGEAGTVFPDIQINLFSQSNITEYGLTIDGKAVPNDKISIFKDFDELGLIFSPDLNADSILSIGTHTAEISITNESGEQITKQWSFTVGVYDVPTLPLPEGSKIVKELPIDPEKILPGQKINGQISVVIYQDKAGKKYTLYKLKTSSGQIITSQNPAFIGRKLIRDRDDPDEVTISPKTHLAFVGNRFNFSYTYVGSGNVLSERWQIRNGGQESTEASVTMAGDLDVVCIVLIEKTAIDADGNPFLYQYEVTVNKHIGTVAITTDIYHDRRMLISNEPSSSISVEGEVWLWLDNTVHEGKKYTLETGELTVDKLRWKVEASEGSPTIKNPVATMTRILFSEHGFAELVFDIKMTYKESAETYESNFKPGVSGLYAFYPVEGKAVFSKFPQAQISVARRYLELKSFEFTIKKQKRLISSPSDFELSEPVLICESSIWPASSPIRITRAIPVISKGHSNNFLDAVDSFTFITPMAVDEDEIPLSLFGRFFFEQEASLINPTLISDLESIPVFDAEDLIELQLSPSELITIQEGQQAEFEAQLAPVYGYGTGLYSATDKSLNVLDGYTISSVEDIFWFEEPLWGDDEEEDWKKKAARTLDFLHVFDPFVGVGSYSMNCGFVMNIQESDTKDEVSAFIVNSTQVNVLPGLRILSPIDKLAYPLNQTIKVTTTLDSEEYLYQWQNIKWKLNGKEFNPEVEKPPFKITLDRVGKWQLEAELKTKDPNTNEEIILIDSAVFEVKPLEISISPVKKVFDFNKQQDAVINISVLVNGDEIEKPGEPVSWQVEDSQLVVDSVAWKLLTAPENCADCDFDDQSFKADCQFANTGAATALATITARIIGAEELFKKKHKGFKDKFEEQIFEIPAGKADLWAVKLGAITNEEKHFPEKSIAKAYRTYEVKSFEFDFESGTRSKKPHTYTAKDGLTEPILLKPACGTESLSASINLKWQVTSDKEIEQKLVEPTKMVIKPTEVCDYKIAAEANLDFGCSALKIGEISTSANAVDLFTLIETKVDPASFTVNVGKIQTLKFVVNSLERTASGNSGSSSRLVTEDESNFLYVLDKSFALSIENVEWSDTSVGAPSPVKTSIEGNPYDFSKIEVGVGTGSANCILSLKEVLEGAEIAQIPDSKIWTWKVNNPALLIIMTDPEGNEAIVTDEIALSSLGITTKFKAFFSDGLNDGLEPIAATWELNGGDVTDGQPIRRGILEELDANIDKTYKIGVFSHGNATCSEVLDSDSVSFVSYLSGFIDLAATFPNGIKKTVNIRLKQPRFEVKVLPVDSVDTEIFFPWQTVVNEVWNRESILQVGSVELGSQIDNVIAPDPPLAPLTIPNAEPLLSENGWGPPSFMNPIVYDSKLVEHFGVNVVPRQPYELSSSRDSGKINVYLVEAPLQYSLIPDFPLPHVGFLPNTAWTIDSNGAKDFAEPGALLDDSLKSGIFVKRITPPFTNGFKRVLAHEIGHTLIQTGDEHFLDGISKPLPPGNLMEGGGIAEGLDLLPAQYISILNLNGKKPNRAIFIWEE